MSRVTQALPGCSRCRSIALVVSWVQRVKGGSRTGSKESKEVQGHSRQELPCFLRLVDVTLVQGTRVPGCAAQRLMELELDDEADKVPAVEG